MLSLPDDLVEQEYFVIGHRNHHHRDTVSYRWAKGTVKRGRKRKIKNKGWRMRHRNVRDRYPNTGSLQSQQ